MLVWGVPYLWQRWAGRCLSVSIKDTFDSTLSMTEDGVYQSVDAGSEVSHRRTSLCTVHSLLPLTTVWQHADKYYCGIWSHFVDPELDVLPVFFPLLLHCWLFVPRLFCQLSAWSVTVGGLKLIFSEPVNENHEPHYVRILANHDSWWAIIRRNRREWRRPKSMSKHV